MKKVLILTVIAIMALGVFALAAGDFGSTTGLTCNTATVTVTSNIYVIPGFMASATVYDATFCGASGALLSGELLTSVNSDLVLGNASDYDSNGAMGVALAGLTVKSNYYQLKVTATGSFNGPTSGPSVPLSGAGVLYTNNGSYDGSTSIWTLVNSESPYTGTAYFYYDNSHINQWVQAGAYNGTITFTITPATMDHSGNFSF